MLLIVHGRHGSGPGLRSGAYRQEGGCGGSRTCRVNRSYYLALQGHAVTVFEALPVAGGMLAVGIPKYRLPKALNHDIDVIKSLGVNITQESRWAKI